MEPNPYAPPKAVVSDVEALSASPLGLPVPGGLYTATQHAVAAFIGSPIAAALIAALNYRRLARDREARNIVMWGVAATVVLVGIAYVLPNRFPSIVVPLVYSLCVRVLADIRFGGVVNAHRAAGGKPASWWGVLAVCLLALVAVGAILFGAAFALAYFGLIE